MFQVLQLRIAPARLSSTLTLCVLLAFPGHGAYAWGPLGHELAGKIAERYVDPSARREIDALIGRESLAEASTWADRMRSDPAPFWQREAGAYHYVTVPPGRRYDPTRAPRKGDALTALARFRGDLLDTALSRERRALALRFAIHIVQDLHQPLHVGNGRDRGGNDVELNVDGKRSNLHRLWDSQILFSAGRSERQWLRYFEDEGLLREPVTEDADPQRWVGESATLRDSLYPTQRQIGSAYFREQLPRAEIRVALAGIRTAAWLNATLADEPAGAPGSDSRQSWWERLFPK